MNVQLIFLAAPDFPGDAPPFAEDPRERPQPADLQPSEDDLAAVERLKDAFSSLKSEMAKVIVGQHAVLEELLIAIFARGHCLLIGVPGLAKTLMIHTLADALNLSYNRIQFTPDLMPSDITGTEVIQEDKATGVRQFKFLRGPIFANIVLADEINRTPPKTQAALLEAMQERQVTVGGERAPAARPVLRAGHPEPDRAGGNLSAARGAARPVHAQHPGRLPVRGGGARHRPADDVGAQAARDQGPLGRRHPDAPGAGAQGADRRPRVAVRDPADPQHAAAQGRARLHPRLRELGRRPRASQYLVLAAKARAVLHGRYHVSTDDIRTVAGPVLRHRIITNFNAEAEGLKPDDIVARLIQSVPVDEHEAEQSGKLPKIFRSANVS